MLNKKKLSFRSAEGDLLWIPAGSGKWMADWLAKVRLGSSYFVILNNIILNTAIMISYFPRDLSFIL